MKSLRQRRARLTIPANCCRTWVEWPNAPGARSSEASDLANDAADLVHTKRQLSQSLADQTGNNTESHESVDEDATGQPVSAAWRVKAIAGVVTAVSTAITAVAVPIGVLALIFYVTNLRTAWVMELSKYGLNTPNFELKCNILLYDATVFGDTARQQQLADFKCPGVPTPLPDEASHKSPPSVTKHSVRRGADEAAE